MKSRNHGLRIAFTGAGGTGKTTTLNNLRDGFPTKFEAIPTLKSSARQVYEGLKISEEIVQKDYTPQQRWELQELIFGQKVKNDDSNPSFIADRTLLDHWAYCLMYCAVDMPKDRFEAMESLVRKHTLTAYSHIFYFPHGYFEAPGDGVRQDSVAWQHAIDSIILGHLVAWGVPAIEVPQTYGEDFRADFIFNNIFNPEEKGEY